ncbi:MAG: hypothetical protein ACYC7E_07190 [Armatimonadota bacterium]
MRSLFCALLLTLAIFAYAEVSEPWTESAANWGVQAHQVDKGDPHVVNLRFDTTFKRLGTGSIAADVVRSKIGFMYSEVRLTFPKPQDFRGFDVLHLSYHLSAGMVPTRLYLGLSTPDWKAGVQNTEAIKPAAGTWQDLTIPLSLLHAEKPGWDWSNVGNINILFFWDVPTPTGVIHVDGVWPERTGEGIGNRKMKPSIIFLDYYEPDKDIDAQHRKAVEAQGFTVAWGLLNKQTWGTLSKFNVAVLGFHPEADANKPGDWTKTMAGKRALLERFVAEGGGLLVTSTPTGASGATGINQLLQPMGMVLINEQVTDPLGITFTQELFPNMTFAYTDAVTRDPLTEGVRGVWYATAVQFTGAGGGEFTAALQPDKEWKVLLRGAKTAATHRPSGSFGLEEAPGTVTESPVLCAARGFGKGRVAVLPMNPTHNWLSGSHPWWNGLQMKTGAKGKPSDFERLLLNLYAYLAEPSRQSAVLGGYAGDKPEPIKGAKYVSAGDEGGIIDWSKMPPPEASKHNYVGLIGAHTAYSDGAGTVAEWVAAAKAAGYKWIAFTESHAMMTEAKWNQLKDECKKTTNADFCAIPGLQIVDPAGNHSLVLAPIPWPDPKLKAERMDLPQAIGYAYNTPAQVQFRLHEGLSLWYRNQFHFVGVFTYRDGKLVDDGEKEYQEAQARNFACWPVAIHETFKPADVAQERKTGFQTYYTRGPLDKMPEDFCYSSFQFFWHHDLAYISSGPLIERFGIMNNGTAYFDIPPEWSDSWRETKGADRWRVHARVSSPAGLAKVNVLDAGTQLRSFAAEGKNNFAVQVDGYHDRQYCLELEVVDNNGGRALAGAAETTAGRHSYPNCSDNVNVMEGGTFGTSDRAPKGYECYFPRWGSWLWPALAIKDAQHLNLPHDERLRFASADCVIVDHFFNLTHDKETLFVGGGRMMRPLYPIKDFSARYRTYHFTPSIDTPDFTLIEPHITLKRDITVTPGGFPNLRFLFYAHGKPMAKGDFAFATLTTEDGRTLVSQTPAADGWPKPSHTGTLPVGGYAGAFPNYTGAGAVFALAPDTQFAIEGNAESRRIQIGKQVAPGTVLKAGAVLTTRVLTMEGSWRQLPGNNQIEDARKMLGMNGKPGYTVTPSIGKVADTLYTCTLAAQNGAFRAKFSQAPLPVDLPIVMPNLTPTWDAGVWIVGAERVRHFGLFEGTGYTTLNLKKAPVEAFLGHPLVCDHPALRITLVEADAKHLRVVVHNPTAKPITTRLRKNAGFTLGPALDTTVTVPAGGSVEVYAP